MFVNLYMYRSVCASELLQHHVCGARLELQPLVPNQRWPLHRVGVLFTFYSDYFHAIEETLIFRRCVSNLEECCLCQNDDGQLVPGKLDTCEDVCLCPCSCGDGSTSVKEVRALKL